MSKKVLEDTTPTQPSQGNGEATIPVKRKKTDKPKAAPAVENNASALHEPIEVQTDTAGEETPGSDLVASKPKRGKWIWLGILIILVIVAIGSGIGYGSAMKQRKLADIERRQVAAATQYELGLNDLASNNLDSARRRFEYVIGLYPEYPGVDEQYAKVLIAIAQNQGGSMAATPQPGTTAVAPVPTKDTRSAKLLLEQAQTQLAAQDWPGLYDTVYRLRDIDPTYESMLVDGLYYLALRNKGITQIQAGSLENGIYNFALAEELAPIDYDAQSYRTWAQFYIQAGSYWGINWPQAVEEFKQLFGMVPNLRDATGITVTQRYAGALKGYGDFLQQTYDWCGAVAQYEQSLSIYADPQLAVNLPQAQAYCANPPATPTPTIDPFAPTPTPTKKPKKN